MNSVSIHAPVKVRTRYRVFEHWYALCFNPRTREGANYFPVLCFICFKGFNPRTREGANYQSSSLWQ